MKIHNDLRSPNFSPQQIQVDFLILHYTACSLERTLEIFMDKAREASAHIVIDENGEIYELVECLDGITHKAWHAGKSRYQYKDKLLEGFNGFSLGIELVNPNGNFEPFKEAQLSALFDLIKQLKGKYPALAQADRILGHEEIAGFRGKSDPGLLFPWKELMENCFPGQAEPFKKTTLPEHLFEPLQKLYSCVPDTQPQRDDFTTSFSTLVEHCVSKELS